MRTALALDKTRWWFVMDKDESGNALSTYRVARYDASNKIHVIASGLTLSLAVQICDEHTLALDIYKSIANYRDNETIIDVDKAPYRRAMLVEG